MASNEMDKSSLEALIRWLEIGAAIFGVVVVVGVAGESFFGIRLLWNNWKLQRLQVAESEAQKAEIARLGNATAEANARAAEAALELAKFKAPRALTSEQQQRLVSKLKAYAGQTFSRNVMNDPEAVNLLMTLTNVLKAAGWVQIPSQTGDVEINGAGMITEIGVKVEVPQNAGPGLIERVKELDAALNDEGIASLPRHDSQLKDPSAINVAVGKKP